MKRTVAVLVVAMGLVALAAPAQAQQNWTWISGTGNWMDNSKWTGGTGTPDYNVDIFDVNVSGAHVDTTTASTFGSSLTITQGLLDITANRTASDLHLAGGQLQYTVNSDATLSGAVTVDSNSPVYTTATYGTRGLRLPQLIASGSVTLDKTGVGRVHLNRDTLSTSFASGTITISDGSLRFQNVNGLCGGTIDVDNASGILQMNVGFANGTVNLKTNGVAWLEAGTAQAANLHLQGGTLEGKLHSEMNVNGLITVDSHSYIKAYTDYGTRGVYLTELAGNGNLTVVDNGRLWLNNSSASASYGGTINITSGYLAMKNAYGLCSGTAVVNSGNGNDSLWLENGFANGAIYLNSGGAKMTANGITVNALHMAAGTRLWADSNRTISAGTIYADGDFEIHHSGGSNGSTTLGAYLQGSSVITVDHNGGGRLILTGDNSSTFTGDWLIVDGPVRLGNVNALGSSGVDVEIVSGEGAVLDYASIGGLDVLIGTLTLGGVEFSNLSNYGFGAGSDTYDITATYNGVNFADYFDGTGTISVSKIPEPATMSLLVLGGLGALLRRRRRS